MDLSTELALNAIKNSFSNYKLFVKHNPLIASEIESALRWISYLITGIQLFIFIFFYQLFNQFILISIYF
jgi:phosphoglycerol transferase MdoB-like AlkP superfamily enzyme